MLFEAIMGALRQSETNTVISDLQTIVNTPDIEKGKIDELLLQCIKDLERISKEQAESNKHVVELSNAIFSRKKQ